MTRRKHQGPNQLNFSTKLTDEHVIPAAPAETPTPSPAEEVEGVYISPSGRSYTEDDLIRLGRAIIQDPTKPTDYKENWGQYPEMGE